MNNLIQSYIDLTCARGEPHSHALVALNEAMVEHYGPGATQYDLSRLYNWRAGKAPLPRTVERIMRDAVLPWAVERHGLLLEDDDWGEISVMVHPPTR